VSVERSGKNRIEKKHTFFSIHTCSLLFPLNPTLFLIS
jgi:hypothetical protein